MIFRFSSGSDTPASASRKRSRGVDDLQLDAGGGHEVLLDLLGLALAHQPVVDVHAGQLGADGLLDEGGGDRGVHSAGQPADGALGADLLADRCDLLLDDVAAWSRSARCPAPR